MPLARELRDLTSLEGVGAALGLSLQMDEVVGEDARNVGCCIASPP